MWLGSARRTWILTSPCRSSGPACHLWYPEVLPLLVAVPADPCGHSVPVLSGPAAPTPEYHRHLMAVLLFLPSAQVRGLEAPLCPASELRVSVGIPRGPEFSGRMAQGSPLARGGTDARPVSSPSSLLDFLSRPRGPVSVPCQSWDTSSNLSLYPYLISASLCWGNHHIAPSCPWQQARTFSPFPRR